MSLWSLCTLTGLPYLAGMQWPKCMTTKMTQTGPKSWWHFRFNSHHQLFKLVSVTFSLASGWLHMAPQSILDIMTGGWDMQGYPGYTMGCVKFQNFRTVGGRKETMRTLYLTLLNFTFYLRLFSHYSKALEYLILSVFLFILYIWTLWYLQIWYRKLYLLGNEILLNRK